ncbi:MAG: Predicted regulator PutR for proline utilization, GntR family [uncultured Paraburkholderia sp.]|nr:MAG: Predicted regulator PutR for proline utilization, GntR family [uncultured Paraburkholderia sp.]CAH2927763.1 MAG: Predicted regulator PutR for proline utilization, GntR family [uncultured Paraburkholderia sp.]
MIAEALREAIVDGTLAPGAPLRQDAIARHFRVSAIPVREVLQQLESEGWAKAAVHKGVTVAPLSADEAREIYEIRSALESLAISLAIPKHTPAARPQLEEDMINTLHRRGERYLWLKFGLSSYKGESDHEHTALLEAVERHDVAAAQALVVAHLLGTGELLACELSKSDDARTRVERSPTSWNI